MSKRESSLNRREFAASLCGGAIAIAMPGGEITTSPAGAAREVEQIERRLVAAISAVDLSSYDRLVADDYVVVQASGGDVDSYDIRRQSPLPDATASRPGEI